MFGKSKKLLDKKIAILATDGFEESELLEPKKALEDAGASVEVISLTAESIRPWRKTDWGMPVVVNKSLDEAQPGDYDGLVLPGGVINADSLRIQDAAVDFAKDFVESGKPIAAICHGPWLLLETGSLEGRKMTSWPSLKTDLENAGVQWVDEEVVTDQGWVTSRKPEDIPAFNAKMVEEFCEGRHPDKIPLPKDSQAS